MKNLKNIIFWAGIFITISTYILVKPLSDLDEIWNFNIARCISLGLVPYKDISMITTPLLSFITAGFLKIFGTEMFVTRMLAIFLAIINLILIYKICKKVNIPKPIICALLLLITFVYKDYFCLDYNFFILAISLIIILLELKNTKKEKTNVIKQIFIGIFGGLALCTKQSIGFFVCLSIVLNQFIFIKNKSDVKKCLKNVLYRIIGIIIPLMIFIIYLLCNKAFYDFLDYCVLGIKTFSNNISYKSLINSENIEIKVLSIIIPIILGILTVANIIKRCIKKENKTCILLNIYSLAIFAMIFPISDNTHFLIGIVPTIILCIYSISLIIKKYIKFSGKYVLEFIEILSMVWVIVFTLYVEYTNSETLGALSKYKSINHFKHIYVSEGINNWILEIDQYIISSDKNVYILDSSAALFMIPIDKYNKNYDMFNIGNLGSGGEESQINRIKNEDAKYLILKDEYGRNWQNPENVRSYITDNLLKTGEIGIYDIYENNIIKEEPKDLEKTTEATENVEEQPVVEQPAGE